jgi:two-component system, OmpR family, sensor kinase
MHFSFFNRLYVRIWLAVVAAVLVMTMLFGWIWRVNMDRVRAERLAEMPARELIVRDAAGQVVGKASSKAQRAGQGLEFELNLPSAALTALTNASAQTSTFTVQVPPRPPIPGLGSQPLPGLPPRWLEGNMQRNPGFMLLLWGVLALGIALGSYPVVRRLTQRLETLQRSVERWGRGDLAARVDASGSDEVAFLAQRFNQAADRIEAMVQTHKSLLANASHELRSPLTRIRMGIELSEHNPSPQRQAELARNINELDALIDEILLASRLDASQHSSIDMGTREAVDMLALVAQECARLNLPLDVLQDAHSATPSNLKYSVHGVARLLRRMVRNLLENANRYGGGQVEVRLGLRAADLGMPALRAANSGAPAMRTADLGAPALRAPGAHTPSPAADTARHLPMLELVVCDRGPGVPESERERIFEPFYRSSNASERDGGVGLGLSLVRSIAQSHAGQVHCLSHEGGGACFVLLVPIQSPQA